MQSDSWLEEIHGELRLMVAIQASAKKNEIVGIHNNRLKIKISSPPVEGAANKAIIVFLSKFFSVKKRDVQIRSGEQSKNKTIVLQGISIGEVEELVGKK